MGKYQDGIDTSALADANLTTKQYHFVMSSGVASGSAERVILGTGASNPAPMGVLQNDPNTGEEAQVRRLGSTLLVVNTAGSTVAYGRYLTCASTGQAEPQDYSAGSLAHAYAMNYLASGSAIIECWVQPGMYVISGS